MSARSTLQLQPVKEECDQNGMQATFVLVWLLVRLQSEREKRLRKGEEEQDERPNSAWLRSLAAEDLPRCENSLANDTRIRHSVSHTKRSAGASSA